MPMAGTWTGRARAAMQAQGISQRTLAEAMDCSRAAVGHYLSGRRRPSLEQMEQIAGALGVDLIWLLRGEGEGIKEAPPLPGTVPILGSTGDGLIRETAGSKSRWYGITVSGSEYSPRIHPGEVAVVDPARTPEPGDEVLVRFRNGTLGLYALVKRSRTQITLETIAGDRTRRIVEAGDVASLHRIVAVFLAP